MTACFGGQLQMREPGGRNTNPSPAVHGGQRRFDHARNGSGAPESVYDGVGCGIHKPLSATIADERQAAFCDNSGCDIRRAQVGAPMLSVQEIRNVLATRGMTIRDLAIATNVDENKLTKSLGKAGRKITVHEMVAITAVLAPEAEEPAVPETPIRTIPWLGSVPAGRLSPAEQKGGRRLAVSDPETPPRAYALTIEGSSMDLIVPSGTTIVVDPDDKALWPGRRYIIMSEDGETTFKEYQDRPARLVPCSSEDHHQEIMLGDRPVNVQGRVFSYSLRDVPRRQS